MDSKPIEPPPKFSTMYNPKLIDFANYVYFLAIGKNNLTKLILQCKLGTVIKGY